MVLVVVTKQPKLWSNLLVLGNYGFGVEIKNVQKQSIEGILTKGRYDFLISDSAAIYKELPPTHTLLIISRQPSLTVSEIIHSLYTSLSLGRRDIPKFVLWLKNNKTYETLIKFFAAWEIQASKGSLENLEENIGKYTYHLVDDPTALETLNSLGAHIILLPTPDAATALTSFLHEIFLSYWDNDARMKVVMDLEYYRDRKARRSA